MACLNVIIKSSSIAHMNVVKHIARHLCKTDAAVVICLSCRFRHTGDHRPALQGWFNKTSALVGLKILV